MQNLSKLFQYEDFHNRRLFGGEKGGDVEAAVALNGPSTKHFSRILPEVNRALPSTQKIALSLIRVHRSKQA